MGVRVPIDATQNVQASFLDVIRELREIQKQIDAIDDSTLQRKVRELQADVSTLEQRKIIPPPGQRAFPGVGPLFLDDQLNWNSPLYRISAKRITTGGTRAVQGDDVALVVTVAAAVTITLPNATDVGRLLFIKKLSPTGGGDDVTIDATGLGQIDGANTLVLNTIYEGVVIVADGVTWNVVGKR